MMRQIRLQLRPGLTKDELKLLGAALVSPIRIRSVQLTPAAGAKALLMNDEFPDPDAKAIVLFVHDGADFVEAKLLVRDYFANRYTGVGGDEAVARVDP